MEEIVTAKGINGILSLSKNKIIIQRKGFISFLTQGLKGDKEIFLHSISAIQMKKAGIFTKGFIQFSFFGGQETKGGFFDATRDENTIMFKKSQQLDFEKIKGFIEKKLERIE